MYAFGGNDLALGGAGNDVVRGGTGGRPPRGEAGDHQLLGGEAATASGAARAPTC